MSEAVLAPLAAWQNFYVIIGTAADRCASERTLAGALGGFPAGRSGGSVGSDLRLHRALGGAPPSELSPGALRLAVVHPLATARLQRPSRRRDSALHLCGTGSVRHRCGNAAARDHGHPQRMGCRDLHGHRSPPVAEPEPGLAGTLRRLACAGSGAVERCRVERPYSMILTRLELSASAWLRMSRVVGEKRIWQSEYN
jgi:hypothetical protein